MASQLSNVTLRRGAQQLAATLAVFGCGALLAVLAFAFSSFLRYPTPFVLLLSLLLIAFSGYAGWSVIELLENPSLPAKRQRQLVFICGLVSPVLASVWVIAQAL